MSKDQFIRDLINELNSENERRILNNKEPINVCFLVSVLDKQIKDFPEFYQDITRYPYTIYKYYKEDEENYDIGRIIIDIHNSDYKYNYYYEIIFQEDMQWLGYCQCSSESPSYNKKYQCCGIDCDWYAPAIQINKIVPLGNSTWKGSQKDYWKYEEEFYNDDKNKNVAVEKYLQKRKLMNQIKELERQLEELED